MNFLSDIPGLEHPVTRGIVLAVAGGLALAPVVAGILAAFGCLPSDVWKRWGSWLVIAPLMIGPVLLGRGWTIAAVALLSLLCFREFSRAVGLFREYAICLTVAFGIGLVTFAVIDHWYGLFAASFPITVVVLAAVGVGRDRPSGYIQRTALGIFAFMLCGCALGHLGYFANDERFQPVLLTLLLTVELSDIAAYITGKSFGRRKLSPAISPGKTVAGFVGAVLIISPLAAWLIGLIYPGTELARPEVGLTFGFVIAVTGQLGDLVLSAVKRDVGIKDMGALFPGHGGLLDRFDSLLLAAPAAFHFIGYFVGVGLDRPARILTGG